MQFGKYAIRSSLGAGGMATVYRAAVHGPGGSARQVALKLIHSHLSEDQEFVLLFLAEMRVALALSHRNIVQTFDAGEIDGRHYMAMELVEGCSLREAIDRLYYAQAPPMPLDIALFITMELCSALEHAHTFRPELTGQPGAVIHRDVSPANVLLSNQGDVKLTDFGVARVMDSFHQRTSNVIKGKMSYMPPEQARGRAEPVSDIFAAGALLYEALAGDRFRHAKSLEDVLTGPKRLPSIADKRDDVSTKLDQLVLRCLAPDPKKRPKSAEALRAELAEHYRSAQSEVNVVDAHARLRDFVKALPPKAEANPAADRLANALMAEAEGVAAAEEKKGTAKTAMMGSGAQGRSVTGRPPTKRGPMILGAGLLVSAVALGVLWLRLPAKSDDAPKNAGTKVDATVLSVASPKGKSPTRSPTTDAQVEADQAQKSARGDLDAAVASKAAPRAKGKLARGRGTLELNSIPWAKVYIDGRYRGHTPLQGLSLVAGAHRIKLVNPQKKLERKIVVRIRRGKATQRVVRLSP